MGAHCVTSMGRWRVRDCAHHSHDVQFQTEDSCKAAAQEIKNEMKATIQGAETHARVVCVRRK